MTDAARSAEPEPRRRRLGLRLLLVAVLVVGLAVGLAFSPLLDVETVTVEGTTPDRVAAVVRASGVTRGSPLLGVVPGRVESRLEAEPWIAGVTVERRLPGTVRIRIVPRVPVGWARVGERVLVVDGTGQVVARPETPPAGVPELLGVARPAPLGGRIRPGALGAVAAAMGAELRGRIATVERTDTGYVAQVRGGPQLRFGTVDRVGAKARVAAAVLASPAAAQARYVDVSVPAAPVSG